MPKRKAPIGQTTSAASTAGSTAGFVSTGSVSRTVWRSSQLFLTSIDIRPIFMLRRRLLHQPSLSELRLPIPPRRHRTLRPFRLVAPTPARVQDRLPQPFLLHPDLNPSLHSPLALPRRLPRLNRSDRLNPLHRKPPHLHLLRLRLNRPSPPLALGSPHLHLPQSPLERRLRHQLRSQLRLL